MAEFILDMAYKMDDLDAWKCRPGNQEQTLSRLYVGLT